MDVVLRFPYRSICHYPGVTHGKGKLQELGVDPSGLEEDDAMGSVDMFGRHSGDHGDPGPAEDDIPVTDLPGRYQDHHLPKGVFRHRYLLSNPGL
jgi:hypothetical protein